jgi:WD40 repeat protein
VDASGSTVLAGFNDGVIRFVSIVSNKTFVLQYVLKPSKSAITFCAFSADGSRLAVSAADKTVFFFHLQIKKDIKGAVQPFSTMTVRIAPLGYICTSSAAESLSFAPEDELIISISGKRPVNGKRLLINGSDGSFSTALIPNDADFDTSATFELNPSAVHLTPWKLNVPEKLVVPVVKAEETIEGDTLQAQVEKTEHRHKSLLLSQSLLSYSLNTLRRQKGLNISSTSFINCSLALTHGYFIAAVENQDNENEIRLCKYLNPNFSLLLGVVVDRVSVLSYDIPKKRLLVGTQRGTCTIFNFSHYALPFDVRDADACPEDHESYSDYVKRFEDRIQDTLKSLQRENPTLDITNPSPYTEVECQQWNGNVHDIVSGRITSFCSSFDGSHFISSGTDGGIFVWKSINGKVQAEAAITADLTEQLNQFAQPDDVVESSAYSIQEEKLKAEKDREIEAAETKKRNLQKQIEDLRHEFTTIIGEIDAQKSSIGLDRAELVVDPYLKHDVEVEAEMKKETLLKELAWQAEKDSIGPEKLMKRFLRPLQHERIEISAFKRQSSVATFRTLALNQQVESALQLQLGDDPQDKKLDTQNESSKGTSNKGTTNYASQNNGSKKSTPKQAQTSVKKLEARKQFRAERAAMWKHLMDSKPDDKYQDPSDVAAIRYAVAHMGDYKLKSAENYIVPESERVDADKKKRQILLLNESIKSLKEVRILRICI